MGTSLVVQWLRLWMQGTWVGSLVIELDPTCHNYDPVQPNKYKKKKGAIFVFRKNFYLSLNLLWTIPIIGEGNGNPLQYSCLENPMDGGAWWAAVHRVATSRTRLSDFTFFFHFNALEKEMATHSSVLAWRIPGMGEPGGLPSVGLHRVGHNWSNLAAAAAYPL